MVSGWIFFLTPECACTLCSCLFSPAKKQKDKNSTPHHTVIKLRTAAKPANRSLVDIHPKYPSSNPTVQWFHGSGNWKPVPFRGCASTPSHSLGMKDCKSHQCHRVQLKPSSCHFPCSLMTHDRCLATTEWSRLQLHPVALRTTCHYPLRMSKTTVIEMQK